MQTAATATLATAQQRMPLDIGALHATHHRRLVGGLWRKGVGAQNLDDAYQDLIVASLERAADYDSRLSAPQTYVCVKHLRAVARTHRTRQIADQYAAPEAAVGDGQADVAGACGIDSYSAGQEFQVALTGFMRAVQRTLTPTESRVFAAAGGLTCASLGVAEREPIAEQLEMSDCALRKQLYTITIKIRTLWPQHFDAPLPAMHSRGRPVARPKQADLGAAK